MIGILLAVALAASPQETMLTTLTTPTTPTIVRAELSRTAVCVGDPITYTVEIACPPGTDILVDDLSRDRLRLQGLEVGSAETEQDTRADGTVVHRVRFHMASYSTDTPSLHIDAISVRYYVRRPGEHVEGVTPTGDIEIPAIDIALRSTLPDGGPTSIRIGKASASLPASAGWLGPLGIAAVALSLVPVFVGLAAFMARLRTSRAARQSTRRSPEEARRALEEIRQLDVTADAAARREAFDRLDAWLRDYLTDLDVPARSLTADEIEASVREHQPGLPGDAIASVLRECQRARFGGPEQLPDGQTLGRALDTARALFE